jgi:hypothetical protein
MIRPELLAESCQRRAANRRASTVLCLALLGLTACSERPLAATADNTSTPDASTSGASTSNDGASDGPMPPDLGSDAVVCGQPGAFADEDFVALAGCELYQGGLLLAWPNATDLSPLISLRVVRDTVTAGNYNTHLETLAGLDNLEWVDSFHFTGDALSNLFAMSNLVGVGVYFALWEMPNLVDLRGLEQLRTVNGTLSLHSNPQLATLDGLGGLEWIGDRLEIIENEKLVSLDGLAALQRVEGDVRIFGNPLLPPAEIDAFLARVEIGGEVTLD